MKSLSRVFSSKTKPDEQDSSPLIVRLVPHLSHLVTDFSEYEWRFPGRSGHQGDVEFTFDSTRAADVVVVLNYLKYDQSIQARKGYIWKWDNEPLVKNPFPGGYDRIYSHIVNPKNPRSFVAAPTLDWWIKKDFDELLSLEVPSKVRDVSAIATTKEFTRGHNARARFIEAIEAELPEIDFFGRGRERELEDKWDGLAPYRYSIAIENLSKPDYWTEKISDCFLSYTVPLYFGATNIGKYFPSKSFIWLPIDDTQLAIRTIRSAIDSGDWEDRLDDVREARELMLNKYSMFGQISSIVRQEADVIRSRSIHTKRVHGRRTHRGGWVRGIGLKGNFKKWKKRRAARSAND